MALASPDCVQFAALDANASRVKSLYKQLQPITVPGSSSRSRFTNWGRTFRCAPLAIFEPYTEEQCQLILELARREGKRVRFSGVGHSPSDLACTTDFMLNVLNLNKLLEVWPSDTTIRRSYSSIVATMFAYLCSLTHPTPPIPGEHRQELCRCAIRNHAQRPPWAPPKARSCDV